MVPKEKPRVLQFEQQERYSLTEQREYVWIQKDHDGSQTGGTHFDPLLDSKLAALFNQSGHDLIASQDL